MSRAGLAATCALIAVQSQGVQAATWLVDPAGGGDFLTIQEAVDASAARDTVLLAMGGHDVGEGLRIDGRTGVPSVTILGQGEPDETVIFSRHSESAPATIYLRNTSPDMMFSGVTMADSSAEGAVHAIHVVGGGLRMNECRIDGPYTLTAVALAGSGELVDCDIVGPGPANGISVSSGGVLRAIRTRLLGEFMATAVTVNDEATAELQSSLIANALYGVRSSGHVVLRDTHITGCTEWAVETTGELYAEGCTVADNGPSSQRGIVSLQGLSTIRNCTIVRNSVVHDLEDQWRAGVQIHHNAVGVSLFNNIIAFNQAVGVRSWSLAVDAECNLLWENGSHNQLGLEPLPESNIVADPLFCDFDNGDYTLNAGSPAAPPNVNPECGLIGAFPVGCGEPVGLPPSTVPPLALQAHPNPFNPLTTLSFDWQASGDPIDLRVFDLGGRLIRVLFQGDEARAVVWDGRDEAGMRVASGVYFARLTAERGSVVEKIVLTR